jgi:hypothetical protein
MKGVLLAAQPVVSFHSFYETTGMTGIPGISGEVS